MTPAEVAALASRTLAEIEAARPEFTGWEALVLDADRKRVASDLAVWGRADGMVQQGHTDHAYYRSEAEAGLRRTAALYGQA